MNQRVPFPIHSEEQPGADRGSSHDALFSLLLILGLIAAAIVFWIHPFLTATAIVVAAVMVGRMQKKRGSSSARNAIFMSAAGRESVVPSHSRLMHL